MCWCHVEGYKEGPSTSCATICAHVHKVHLGGWCVPHAANLFSTQTHSGAIRRAILICKVGRLCTLGGTIKKGGMGQFKTYIKCHFVFYLVYISLFNSFAYTLLLLWLLKFIFLALTSRSLESCVVILGIVFIGGFNPTF